ncbi:ubiquitin-protein ligase peroxin 12, partial [Linderina macrospora]
HYEKVSGGEAARLLGGAFAETDEVIPDDVTGMKRLVLVAKKWFKRYYPHANFAYHMATALYYVAYMFDRTAYNSPWLHLLGLQVRRLTAADYRAMDERGPARSGLAAPANGSIIRYTRNLLARMLTGGLDFLKVLLPLSIFFYRFLEWWYRSDFHRKVQQAPVPPPPMPLKPHLDGVAVPEDQTLCPLCLKPRTNPAMAPSGYVFCYPCIHRHVDETGLCPVTLTKAMPAGIRKIYSMAA